MKQLRDHKSPRLCIVHPCERYRYCHCSDLLLIKLAGSGSFGDVAETTEAATQTRIQPAAN